MQESNKRYRFSYDSDEDDAHLPSQVSERTVNIKIERVEPPNRPRPLRKSNIKKESQTSQPPAKKRKLNE